MNITGKGKVFKGQYGYSIGESEKKLDGTYDNYYVPLTFPKNMSILPDDKETIEIEHGFTKHYKTKDGKSGISYMVMKWHSVGVNKEDKPKIETKEVEDPYAIFAKEIEITSDMLPF